MRRNGVFLFWLAAGWLLAAVAVNRVFSLGLVNYQALYGYVAAGWSEAAEGQQGVLFRILLIRLAETAAVAAVCKSRFQGLGCPVLLLTAGFCGGASLVLFTWCRGPMGLVCFLLTGFPHELFYGAAWWILMKRYLFRLSVRWGRFWSGVAVLVAAGLLSEFQLNPLLLRFL